MKKKFNETMIIRDGKMIYAVQLRQNGNSDRCYIYIREGKVYFGDSYFTPTEFDFENETHKIAKEIFINQLQTDIKARVLELKQLEEIFKELNLSECFSDIIPNSAKILTEVKNEVKEHLDNKIIALNADLEKKVENQIEEEIRPIARKKKKKGDKNKNETTDN